MVAKTAMTVDLKMSTQRGIQLDSAPSMHAAGV